MKLDLIHIAFVSKTIEQEVLAELTSHMVQLACTALSNQLTTHSTA